eukprot:973491-Prymnesium_polylepis.1
MEGSWQRGGGRARAGPGCARLQRECGVVLLVVVVPHVERAVHLGRDEHARPCGRPRGVEHVVLEVFRRHDRVADLLVP